jgi:hypothetical protein
METDLNEMTYLKYANVLSYLADFSGNLLLIQAILIELGFAKEVAARITSKQEISSTEIELVEICNLTRVQRNGEKVLLGIGGSVGNTKVSTEGDLLELEKRGAGSVTENWRISQLHAVLPVFLPDNLKVLSDEKKFTPTIVFSEGGPGINLAGAWNSLQTKFLRLLPAGSAATLFTLVAPPDLDTAVAEAKKQLPIPPPPPLPKS